MKNILLCLMALSNVFTSPIYLEDDREYTTVQPNAKETTEESFLISNEMEDEPYKPAASVMKIMPTRKSIKKHFWSNPLVYNIGGPVITDTVNVYYIWYGKWEANDKNVLENLASGIDTTNWYGLMKSYYSQQTPNATKQYINGKVTLKKVVTDDYSHGKNLKPGDVSSIVVNQMKKGNLPIDKSAVYFVLTAGDVEETSDHSNDFGGSYCGYHYELPLVTNDVQDSVYVSFVGLPTRYMSVCGDNGLNTPNDPPVDAAASALAHELVETISNPADNILSWVDKEGQENGDKCAYKFGSLLKNEQGVKYNVKIGTHYYKIQQNWDVVSQSCKSGIE